MSPSNDYPFYLLRKFILSCVLFRLFRSTNRTLTLLCTRKNSHTASHLLIAYTTPGGISLTSPQVPLSLSLHSHRSLLSFALACPFFSVTFQSQSSPWLLDSIPKRINAYLFRSLSMHRYRSTNQCISFAHLPLAFQHPIIAISLLLSTFPFNLRHFLWYYPRVFRYFLPCRMTFFILRGFSMFLLWDTFVGNPARALRCPI